MRRLLMLIAVGSLACPGPSERLDGGSVSDGGGSEADGGSDAGRPLGPHLNFTITNISGQFHAVTSVRTIGGNIETNSATADVSANDAGLPLTMQHEIGYDTPGKTLVNVRNTYDGGAVRTDGGRVYSACDSLGEGEGTSGNLLFRVFSDGGTVSIGTLGAPLRFTSCGQAEFTQPLRNELVGSTSVDAFRDAGAFQLRVVDTQTLTNAYSGPEAWWVDLTFVIQPLP